MKRLIKVLASLPLVCTAATSFTVNASCLDAERLTGVNTAGAEFNSKNLPGTIFKDYVYPTQKEINYIADQGANVIRLPFRWERIQLQPSGPLNKDELKRIRSTVAHAKSRDVCVILDVHNYAKYGNDTLEEKPALQDAFVDLWLRLAREFPDPNDTIFGLMNEPTHLPIPAWATLAKRTLAELRKADAKNVVFIGGGHWSGLHDWFTSRGGQSNANAFADVRDPLNRTVLEAHQYADEWYAGSGKECHEAEHFNRIFQRTADWARENKQKFFIGEFGVPQNENCLKTLDHMLSLMTDADVWKGWTYWATGAWWGNYPLALNTNAATPSPQWKILKRYFFENNPPNPPEIIE